MPKPKLTQAVEIFDEIEQGSDEWLQLRLGIPTASVFGIIMSSGKNGEEGIGRARLMRLLAGEILTGRPAEGKFKTAAMQRGLDMEPGARAYYARTNFVELHRVGFIRRRLPTGRWVGCSPDALIIDVGRQRLPGEPMSKKALEIKTMAPDLLIEHLEKGAGLPSHHRPQVHGTMWVADLEEVDLLLYYEGMPVNPKFTIWRDETYIREIAKAVELFEYETQMLVEKIRRMG